MSVKKGDVVRIQWEPGESYQLRVTGMAKYGFRGTWLDGPLVGRDALVERSVVVHRGRLPVQVGGRGDEVERAGGEEAPGDEGYEEGRRANDARGVRRADAGLDGPDAPADPCQRGPGDGEADGEEMT